MALCTNSKVSCLYNILIIYIDKYRHTLLLACVPQIDTMHPLSVEGAFLTITPTRKTIGCICLGFMVFYGKTQR